MWKYVIARSFVPTIWPIQEGSDLIQKEVIILEEVGFSFDYSCAWSLFGSQLSSSSISHVLVMNVHSIMQLIDVNCWPTTHGGKKVRQPFVLKITQQHTNNWEVGILLTQCIIFLVVDVPSLGYGRIYNILLDDKGYDVIIGNYRRCSCVYFVTMLASYLGGRGVYVQCTCVSHLIDDYVLWAHGGVPSSLHMKLGWSSSFVETLWSFWILVIIHHNLIQAFL